MRIIVAMVLLIVLSGCQAMSPAQPAQRQVEFPADEYAVLEKVGDAAVEGQLFLRTRGGDVKYGAGSTVIVAPVTSYSEEATRIIRSGRSVEDADPRAQEYTRRVQADGEGRFRVEDLPAGDYFVAGGVYWEAPVKYAPMQGGMVIKRVSLEGNETERVMLTR